MRIAVALLLVSAAEAAAQLPQPPVAVESFAVAPRTLAGGGAVTLTVSLVGRASSAGQNVGLRYSSTDVLDGPPASVRVPGGRDRVAITLVTRPTAARVAITVSAASAPSLGTWFEVRPPRVETIRFARPTLPGGDSTTMTVRFDGPTPGPMSLELQSSWTGFLFYWAAPPNCVMTPCPWGSQVTSPVSIPGGATEQRLRVFVSLGGPPTPSITARLGNSPAVTKSLQVLKPRPASVGVASGCPVLLPNTPFAPMGSPTPGPKVVVSTADRTVGLGESVALSASDPEVVLPAGASYSATVYATHPTVADPMPMVLQRGRVCVPVTFPQRGTTTSYRITASSGGLSVSQTVSIPPGG